MPAAHVVSSAVHRLLIAFAILLILSPLVTAKFTESPSTDPHFWDIDIDNDPAPSPEDGPPGARHASRNRALLPAQICGIVGAYALCVLGIGLCLLTCGRRMRRDALAMANAPPPTKEIELMKSPGLPMSPHLPMAGLPASPRSPRTEQGWWRNHLPMRSPRKSEPNSPGMSSVSSFDTRVIENDKAKAANEMESLYAAVMAHEARKSQTSVVHEDPKSPVSATFPTSPFQPVNKNVLRIATGKPEHGPNPLSPTSPNYRAIHPPGAERLPYGLVSPTTPGSVAPGTPGAPPSPLYSGGLYPAAKPGSSPRKAEVAQPAEPPHSPRSPRFLFGSKSRTGSVSSQGSKTSKLRKPLSNIRISQPFKTGEEEDRTPLTPRKHDNVPPPPSPPTQPPTPHTGDSSNRPPAYRHHGPYAGESEAYEAIDEPAPLPRPAPQRGALHPSNQAQANGISPISARSSSNDLPLRSTNNSTAELPLRSTHDTNSPVEAKTTFIERKKDPMVRRGPLSAALPKTAGTPYSPYMPFTPITPVTPHLVSRSDRKAAKKYEGPKRARFEEDQVIDENDMWGNGY